MRDIVGSALKLGLAAVIVALGLIASFSLPPTFLLGSAVAPQTSTVAASGRLQVTVMLHNGTGSNLTPMQGVSVGVAQVAQFGLRAVFTTDRDGNVSFMTQPGIYGISIVDPRFSTTISATVSSGATTRVGVSVNRTALYAVFAQVQDSTGEEKIGPWNKLVVAVAPSFPLILTNQNATASLPHFGGEVFLRPLRSDGFGSEVPATVIAQVPSSQSVWLTLRPGSVLEMTGAYLLTVSTYSASSAVSMSNA